MKESIDFIYKQQKELSVFGGIAALLGWDQMTYMPKNSAQNRSEQSALISRLSHDKVISDEFWNHIENLNENIENLSKKDKIVVQRLRKDVEKSRKIPSDFVERLSKTTTIAYTSWQEAREKANFKIFLSNLEKIVGLEKEYCGYINLPGPSYNSLLDDYEEGMTIDKLKKEFEILKPQIINILEKIKSTKTYEKQSKLNLKFSVEKQKKICNTLFEKLNLPKDKSRIDVSTHPFTTSLGYDDVRITTNYEHPNPFFSLFSTIHEGGHALYELGFPQDEYKYTVISDSSSLGMHESQSRFWENMIARNKHFWKYFYPIFKETDPKQLSGINLDFWYKNINQVTPSFIRVEADELTYGLHVILRFELEVSLFEEEISVKELPNYWNEKMNEMLGIIPPSDKEGVLQDMHWSSGAFGYFPTYLIGSIYASQFFKKLSEENPNIFNELEEGEYKNILAWLRKNIHRFGRLKTSDEIVKMVCGEGLNSKVFINYLKDKYYKLYEV
jgi:carboxypeptidase Taq